MQVTSAGDADCRQTESEWVKEDRQPSEWVACT